MSCTIRCCVVLLNMKNLNWAEIAQKHACIHNRGMFLSDFGNLPASFDATRSTYCRHLLMQRGAPIGDRTHYDKNAYFKVILLWRNPLFWACLMESIKTCSLSTKLPTRRVLMMGADRIKSKQSAAQFKSKQSCTKWHEIGCTVSYTVHHAIQGHR